MGPRVKPSGTELESNCIRQVERRSNKLVFPAVSPYNSEIVCDPSLSWLIIQKHTHEYVAFH